MQSSNAAIRQTCITSSGEVRKYIDRYHMWHKVMAAKKATVQWRRRTGGVTSRAMALLRRNRINQGTLIRCYSLNNPVTDARYSGQLSESCSNPVAALVIAFHQLMVEKPSVFDPRWQAMLTLTGKI